MRGAGRACAKRTHHFIGSKIYRIVRRASVRLHKPETHVVSQNLSISILCERPLHAISNARLNMDLRHAAASKSDPSLASDAGEDHQGGVPRLRTERIRRR